MQGNYLEKYSAKQCVYLTADAEETLEELKEEEIYIIGGLVDRNRLKKATLDKAKAEGVRTARLPIGSHVKLLSSSVLTVNHVFEMIIRKVNGMAWGEAIEQSIPKRKIQSILQKQE